MPADVRDVVVQARRLSKTAGRTRLVDEVSFEVRRSDVYVLVGAEGSGKSTIARMIVGLVMPTTGEAKVLGTPMGPGAFSVFERVGYASDAPAFRGGLTCRQELTSAMALRGSEDASAVERGLSRVGLQDVADERSSSIGDDRTRLLGIARALVASPELLVLDEPTRGLGRRDRRAVVTLLRELAVERQVTIVACSHAADGLIDVATRLAVLHEGRLVEEFDRDGVRERGRSHIEVVVSDTASAARVLEEDLGCTDFAVCQERLVRVYVPADRAGDINAALLAKGVGVNRLSVNEGSLEDLLERLSAEGGRSQ